MRTFVATVEVEFTCTSKGMVSDRIMGIPFGDRDCGFRIRKVKEGRIKKGKDETLLPKYRKRHGCDI